MADVFVSYKREDRQRCLAMAKALREQGYSVWMDEGIHAGASWDREIEREIAAAAAVLVLWSRNSRDSDWVRNEARVGKRSGKLVSIRIEECEPPLEFSGIQTVDVFNLADFRQTAGWRLLLERIDRLTDPSARRERPDPPRPPLPERTDPGGRGAGKAGTVAIVALLAVLAVSGIGIWSYLANRSVDEGKTVLAEKSAKDFPSPAESDPVAYDPPQAMPQQVAMESDAPPPVQVRADGGVLLRFDAGRPPLAQLERGVSRVATYWRDQKNEWAYIYVMAYPDLRDSDIAAGSNARGQIARRLLLSKGVPNSAILFHASDGDSRPEWPTGEWSTDGRVEVFYSQFAAAGFAAPRAAD